MNTIAESNLSNEDLAPTGPERRTWGTYNLAALWIGLSIVITTYTLASGLIAAGMEWWQGLLTVARELYKYGVFVAFPFAAATYVVLMRAEIPARSPAGAAVE